MKTLKTRLISKNALKNVFYFLLATGLLAGCSDETKNNLQILMETPIADINVGTLLVLIFVVTLITGGITS